MNHKKIILFIVTLLAAIDVLDVTVVTVALPNMMGSLGLTYSEATWIITSYAIATAIALPVMPIFTRKLGERHLIFLSTLGFLVGSLGCGFSSNLYEICFFRVFQGFLGANLVPLAQSIIQENFSKEDRAKAIAIWAVGVTAVPLLGPTLGGYIVETFGWPMIFFINVPVCIIAAFLSKIFIFSKRYPPEKFDGMSFIFACIGFGLLQFFLDKGHTLGWFSSELLSFVLIISVVFLSLLIYRCLHERQPLIRLSPFKNRNFLLACSILFLICITFLSINALQEIFIQNIYGLPPLLAGAIQLPSAFFVAIAMAISTKSGKWGSPKAYVCAGIFLLIFGTAILGYLPPYDSVFRFILADTIRSTGFGLCFVPLMLMGFVELKPEENVDASGLFNFVRNFGSATGVAMITTILSYYTQYYWHVLGGFISPYHEGLSTWVQQQHSFSAVGYTHNPALGILWAGMLGKQSFVLGYSTACLISLVGYVGILGLLFFMRTPKSYDNSAMPL